MSENITLSMSNRLTALHHKNTPGLLHEMHALLHDQHTIMFVESMDKLRVAFAPVHAAVVDNGLD